MFPISLHPHALNSVCLVLKFDSLITIVIFFLIYQHFTGSLYTFYIDFRLFEMRRQLRQYIKPKNRKGDRNISERIIIFICLKIDCFWVFQLLSILHL